LISGLVKPGASFAGFEVSVSELMSFHVDSTESYRQKFGLELAFLH
jgi:hypothetical protein